MPTQNIVVWIRPLLVYDKERPKTKYWYTEKQDSELMTFQPSSFCSWVRRRLKSQDAYYNKGIQYLSIY